MHNNSAVEHVCVCTWIDLLYVTVVLIDYGRGYLLISVLLFVLRCDELKKKMEIIPHCACSVSFNLYHRYSVFWNEREARVVICAYSYVVNFIFAYLAKKK
eukprot:869881_1